MSNYEIDKLIIQQTRLIIFHKMFIVQAALFCFLSFAFIVVFSEMFHKLFLLDKQTARCPLPEATKGPPNH
jgi:hypothetical protein